MSYVPRCASCWRVAVARTRDIEASGRPRPRCFDVYLATYRRNHVDGPGPMKCEAPPPPLVVAGFGGGL